MEQGGVALLDEGELATRKLGGPSDSATDGLPSGAKWSSCALVAPEPSRTLAVSLTRIVGEHPSNQIDDYLP